MGINEEDIGRIKQAVDDIKESVGEIADAVYGNSNSGLIDRTARIEEKVAHETQQVLEFREYTTKTLGEHGVVLARIENLLSLHFADTNLHTPKGLLVRANVIAPIIGLVVLVNLVIPKGIEGAKLLLKLVGL